MAAEPVATRADAAFRDLVIWISASQRKQGVCCAILNGVTIKLTLRLHGKPQRGVVVTFSPQTPNNTVFGYLSLHDHEISLRVSEGPAYVLDGRHPTSIESRVDLLAEVLTTLDSFIHYPKDG